MKREDPPPAPPFWEEIRERPSWATLQSLALERDFRTLTGLSEKSDWLFFGNGEHSRRGRQAERDHQLRKTPSDDGVWALTHSYLGC